MNDGGTREDGEHVGVEKYALATGHGVFLTSGSNAVLPVCSVKGVMQLDLMPAQKLVFILAGTPRVRLLAGRHSRGVRAQQPVCHFV